MELKAGQMEIEKSAESDGEDFAYDDSEYSENNYYHQMNMDTLEEEEDDDDDNNKEDIDSDNMFINEELDEYLEYHEKHLKPMYDFWGSYEKPKIVYFSGVDYLCFLRNLHLKKDLHFITPFLDRVLTLKFVSITFNLLYL